MNENRSSTFIVDENDAVYSEQLKVAQRLDELTQVGDIRYAHSVLNYQINLANRYTRPFSVLLLDVDDYMQVVDAHGASVAEGVLKEVASILKQKVRNCDFVCRWSEKAFLIICPETEQNGAITLADALCGLVRSHSYPEAQRITASIGVAGFIASDNIDTLVLRVSQRLYHAKLKGKNQVVFL